MPLDLPVIEAQKDPNDMTPEEYDAWLAEPVPDPPPPSAWPLHCNDGRVGFLESFMWRGEVALFESVSHIWALLNEPKNARCIGIGLAAGTGGSGKWALAKMLRKALRESLDSGITPPWGQKFGSIDLLHEAAMNYFNADYAHYEKTVQKYADILNGEPGRHVSPAGTVIVGPWRALPRPDTVPRSELLSRAYEESISRA